MKNVQSRHRDERSKGPTGIVKRGIAQLRSRCLVEPVLSFAFLARSHRQYHAELGLAAQHSRISLAGFFERKCFNHRTHTA